MNLKEKRIIVTGGEGFLGKFIVEELEKRDSEVFVIPHSKYELTQERYVVEMFHDFPADIIIHAAADIGGLGYSKDHSAKQFYDNSMMNMLVQHHAYKNDITKFVGIGTVCSYPKNPPIPFKEENLWDGYPQETNAGYGMSKKVMLEQSLAYREQYGFNAIHLLIVNLYGIGDNCNIETSHVIPALVYKMLKAKKDDLDSVNVWGDGSATREFFNVRDAARGIAMAAESYDKPDPVNLGTGKEVSIKELVEIVKDVTDYKGEIEWDIGKPTGQDKRVLDVSKAKKEFGFEYEIGLRDGLTEFVDWYKENFKI
jgi:GDP-L-fucose synthase